MKKTIIGLHYGHDATIVLIRDNEIIEAMSEERLSKQKKHLGFPTRSLEYVKHKYSLTKDDLETVYTVGTKDEWDSHVLTTEEDNIRMRKSSPESKDYFYSLKYSIPGVKQTLSLYYRLKTFTREKAMASETRAYLKKMLPGSNTVRLPHHDAHAWATVPFLENKSADHLIFTLDGAGDNISGSVSLFMDGKMQKVHEISFDSSLGLLYSAVVDFLGMKRNEHEFKVMGLAPYAKASHGDEVYKKLAHLFWFNKHTMTFESAISTSDAVAYFIAHNFHKFRFDSLAYGIQKLTEECVKDLIQAYCNKYSIYNIALGGGVFMNVKANQSILELPEIMTLTIAPSCGDESLAIGSAVFGFVFEGNDIRTLKPVKNLYLGSEYSHKDIQKAIDSYAFLHPISQKIYTDPAYPVEMEVAKLLSENNVVGRFKGRAEWGARALGNRSILANASSKENVKLINEMIKGRDFWMPFATSLISEDQHLYLENPRDFFAPYMSITFKTTSKAIEEIPAALHPYDMTSRPQMVSKEMNPDYHTLLHDFKKLTNSSGILNTSFNLHGEPNVETPIDALRTFDLSGLQYLAIGNIILSKNITKH